MLQYHLPSGAIKLSNVFELIENHLDDLEIEDYSVSQTTLDNVRLNERMGGKGGPREGERKDCSVNGRG